MNSDTKQSSATAPEIEPTSASTTVPMWLVGLTLVLLFLTAWYFDARGGWFEEKVYGPYLSVADVQRFQPKLDDGSEVLRKGMGLYNANCALCHNTDGTGKVGQAPPFAGSEWVLTEGVNRLIRIPLVGLAGPIKVKGQDWNLNMAAMGAQYSDEDLAAVLSYIRNSWGNKASLVTVAQVKAVRTAIGNRSQPYSLDELMKESEK